MVVLEEYEENGSMRLIDCSNKKSQTHSISTLSQILMLKAYQM